MAIIAFVGGLLFWWFFTRPWDAQEEAMNMLKESSFKGSHLGGDDKLEKQSEAAAVKVDAKVE